MNQILATSNVNSGKNKGPASIKSVVKFFIVALIIFGVFLIGTGSYAIYKENADKNAKPTKPVIDEERKSDTTILLKIKHDKAIDRIEYVWNDEEIETITGNGRRYIEQEVTIPGGINTLSVRVVDINGQEISYKKDYESKDIISFELAGSKLKILAKNTETISYLTYRWDEESETKVDINNTEVDHEIDIPKGQHTLTVVLVDINNNTITKKQEVKGVTKPMLSVSVDNPENPTEFIIKASDENELDAITFIINDDENQKYIVRAEGKKELEQRFPLQDGENRIWVTAYNMDGATAEFKGMAKK